MNLLFVIGLGGRGRGRGGLAKRGEGGRELGEGGGGTHQLKSWFCVHCLNKCSATVKSYNDL